MTVSAEMLPDGIVQGKKTVYVRHVLDNMAPAINSVLYSILCAAKLYEWDPYMLNLTPIGKVINGTMTLSEKMTTELVYGQPMQTCIVKRFISLAESGQFFIYESSLPENKAQ